MSDTSYVRLNIKKENNYNVNLSKYNPYYDTYYNEDIGSDSTDDEDVIVHTIDKYLHKKDSSETITYLRAKFIENIKCELVFVNIMLLILFGVSVIIFWNYAFSLVTVSSIIGLYGITTFNKKVVLYFTIYCIVQFVGILTYIIYMSIIEWNILMFITTISLLIMYLIVIYKQLFLCYIIPSEPSILYRLFILIF